MSVAARFGVVSKSSEPVLTPTVVLPGFETLNVDGRPTAAYVVNEDDF